MSKKELTDICHTDTAADADLAIDMRDVTKTFVQSQREIAGKGLLKNLLRPEKKIKKALDKVSLRIKKGEFAAYAGPNGAGKSTTMKLLAGILLPNEGEISVMGMSPKTDRVRLMSQLGVLFGNRTELWWDHPVLQSFEWKKVVWNIPDEVYRRNLEMATDLLDIGDLLKTFARELSLGQRMRADLTLMLLHSPSLILLDEPTLGLDVVAKRQMIEFLKRVNRDDGVTILVTSHDMDDLEEMARRILMISDGKLAFDGSFEGLRSLTGSPSRIRITTDPGSRPSLNIGSLVSESDGVYEYELDLSETPVHRLLLELSSEEGIRDVEIRKAPIEQVITELYKLWKR